MSKGIAFGKLAEDAQSLTIGLALGKAPFFAEQVAKIIKGCCKFRPVTVWVLLGEVASDVYGLGVGSACLRELPLALQNVAKVVEGSGEARAVGLGLPSSKVTTERNGTVQGRERLRPTVQLHMVCPQCV